MLPTWVDDAGMLVRGVNVRRDDAEREVWRPAGIPKTIREDSWVPLQEVELPGTGKCATFMISRHTLGTIVSPTDARGTDRLHGAVAAIGIITGEPLRFDVVTPGLVRVLMRHERTVYLTYRVTAGDGSPGGGIAWQNHGTMPEMPALSIVPTDETTLSEGFGAMSLSGTGATRGSLALGDEKIVSDRVMNAYSRLKAQASATGFYIQPTLARCRILDAAGDTIRFAACHDRRHRRIPMHGRYKTDLIRRVSHTRRRGSYSPCLQNRHKRLHTDASAVEKNSVSCDSGSGAPD